MLSLYKTGKWTTILQLCLIKKEKEITDNLPWNTCFTLLGQRKIFLTVCNVTAVCMSTWINFQYYVCQLGERGWWFIQLQALISSNHKRPHQTHNGYIARPFRAAHCEAIQGWLSSADPQRASCSHRMIQTAVSSRFSDNWLQEFLTCILFVFSVDRCNEKVPS